MTRSASLFDTRGGSLLISRCEVCNETLEDDAVLPVCASCEDSTDPADPLELD